MSRLLFGQTLSADNEPQLLEELWASFLVRLILLDSRYLTAYSTLTLQRRSDNIPTWGRSSRGNADTGEIYGWLRGHI